MVKNAYCRVKSVLYYEPRDIFSDAQLTHEVAVYVCVLRMKMTMDKRDRTLSAITQSYYRLPFIFITTVKHILIECNFLKIIRRRHYDVTDLNQLFKTVSSKRILDFVKDIGLYSSL